MSLFNTVNIVRFGGYNRGGRGIGHPLRFFLRKEYRGEDAVGELMRDFHCSDYRDMKNKTLASMVQYYTGRFALRSLCRKLRPGGVQDHLSRSLSAPPGIKLVSWTYLQS